MANDNAAILNKRIKIRHFRYEILKEESILYTKNGWPLKDNPKCIIQLHNFGITFDWKIISI